MRVLFHKLTGERHALEIIRDDGRRERVECETRSFLLHDLVHLAVESEGRLAGGFWGSLAAGKTLAQLNDRMPESASRELMAIEGIVARLQTGTRGGPPAAEIVAAMRRSFEAQGETMPSWISEAFVDGVKERLRRLLGHWRATPFGKAMELTWPLLP